MGLVKRDGIPVVLEWAAAVRAGPPQVPDGADPWAWFCKRFRDALNRPWEWKQQPQPDNGRGRIEPGDMSTLVIKADGTIQV